MISTFLLLAGKGTRFGGNIPKQYLQVKNKYIFEYSLGTFDSLKEIDKIYLVCDEEHEIFLKNFLKNNKFNHDISVILGGKSRQESVYNSLKSLQNLSIFDDLVLFHDACRPLVRKHEILNLIYDLKTYDGASLSLPLYDSLCEEDNLLIKKSIKREKLRKLQTPQGFKFGIIYKAHLEALKNHDLSFTDDTSLLTYMGKKVKLVDGSIFNFKITTKDDLILFEKILEGFDFD